MIRPLFNVSYSKSTFDKLDNTKNNTKIMPMIVVICRNFYASSQTDFAGWSFTQVYLIENQEQSPTAPPHQTKHYLEMPESINCEHGL